MGLKSTIRNFQLKKWIKNSPKSAPYKGFDSVEWIGISFEKSKLNDEIFSYADKMKSCGKKVQLLEYIPKSKKEIEKNGVSSEVLSYCKSDVNYSGVPQNSNIAKFLNQEMDVFLDLNSKLNHPSDFICLKARASLKAGSNLKEELCLDLMLNIAENNNFDQLFKELDYYLNFINHK